MIETLGTVAILVGAAAGLGLLFWARRLGHAQAKFWRQALVVMQVIYLVFALVARSAEGALREGVVLAVFWLVALAAARFSAWFVAFGILAHGFWDLRHLIAVEGYVVPFYAEACVGFDWLVFVYLLIHAAAWDRARRSARLASAAA